MAITKLTVMNDALALLGQPPLESPDDPGEDGKILRAYWTDIVELAHEATAWDFAKLRKKLPRLPAPPLFGYAYYYALPGDVLRTLVLSSTGDQNDELTDYEIEVGKVATDASDVYLIYVSEDSVTQMGRWSHSFAHYVATELALRGAPKINSSATEDIVKERKKAKSDAIGLDGAQGPPKKRRPGQWARSARGHRAREQG